MKGWVGDRGMDGDIEKETEGIKKMSTEKRKMKKKK